MAQPAYYQIRAREMMWDIPRIISAEQLIQGGYSGSFKLAPTALLPGVWMLQAHASLNCYVWDIHFSTDTAISWTLFKGSGLADLTNRNPINLNINNANNPQATWSADVVAAPANVGTIMQGFAAANSYFSILNKGWLLAQGTTYILMLVTGLVAANCTCTMHWTEINT
jgi:hypothetical protein